MMRKSLYFVTDKALRDALSQKKYSNNDIQDLFFSRGILHSRKTSRQEIATHFSRLNHDYIDHQNIAEILGSITAKEKSTAIVIKNSPSDKDIKFCIKKIVRQCFEEGNSASWKSQGTGFLLNITYTDFNFNKSEFRQVSTRDADFVVEQNNDEITVRFPSNEFMNSVSEKFLDLLAEKMKVDIDVEKIELTGVDDPKLITKFFENIVSGLEGLDLYDVSDAHVFNPGSEDESKVYINRASLKGMGVSRSTEIKGFQDRGFYIYRLAWSSRMSHDDSFIYNFEAQFENPSERSGFSYLIRGRNSLKSDGEYSESKHPLPLSEEISLLRLIEKAARSSMKSLV